MTNADGRAGKVQRQDNPERDTQAPHHSTINECLPGRKCLQLLVSDQPMFCFVAKPYNRRSKEHASNICLICLTIRFA